MGKWIDPTAGFTGTVGPLVGSSINGRHYIKSKYRKRRKKAKGGEKLNHNKFQMAHKWLQPILDYVREGFQGFNYKPNSQGFNAAKAYVLNNAFEGEAAVKTINPALVKVSYGSLPFASNMAVVKLDDDTIKFTWENVWTTGMGAYDQAMLLAYDIKNKQASMLTTGQIRQSGESTLNVQYNKTNKYRPKGGTFHCYLAFVAADRSRYSDSVYLGEITF